MFDLFDFNFAYPNVRLDSSEAFSQGQRSYKVI